MSGSLLAELVAICGPGAARVARQEDRIAGCRAGFVAAPATPRSVAELLRIAVERDLSVRPRGSGSKIDWGGPLERLDLIIDTGRLNGMWEHDGSTAVVAAGTPVGAVQAALGAHGKRLTVDPPSSAATIGGMLAVNEAGPLRHRFGPPAGQAASVTFVDPAGQVVESAEWEGSADVVITSAVLPIEALPEARSWVVHPVSTPTEVGELVTQVVAQEFALSGVEMDLPGSGGGALALLLEGPTDWVSVSSGRLARQLGPEAVISARAPGWWGSYPFGPGEAVLRIRARARDLRAVSYVLLDAVGTAVPIRGSAVAGVVHAVLPRGLSAARITDIVVSLKQVLLARRGQVAILTAPAELTGQIQMARLGDLF